MFLISGVETISYLQVNGVGYIGKLFGYRVFLGNIRDGDLFAFKERVINGIFTSLEKV